MILYHPNFISDEQVLSVLNNLTVVPNDTAVPGGEYHNEWYSHTIVERAELLEGNTDTSILSKELYGKIKSLLDSFCLFNNITYSSITRMCINVTKPSEDKYVAAMHVDHEFPHSLVIFYLNNSDGATVLSGTTEKDEEPEEFMRIPSHKGSILYMSDGGIFHTASPPTQNLRVVCVTTLT
jgi:hypothetical protein